MPIGNNGKSLAHKLQGKLVGRIGNDVALPCGIVDGKKVRAVGLDGKDGQSGDDGKVRAAKAVLDPCTKFVDMKVLAKFKAENGQNGSGNRCFRKIWRRPIY